MRSRGPGHTYRAVRVDAQRWDLRVDGFHHSYHRGFRDAQMAASAIDKKSRARAAVVRHALIFTAASLMLASTQLFRQIANPEYSPARAFADRIEEAYRAIDAGEAEITDFSLDSDGFEGRVYEVDQDDPATASLVMTGQHEGDCYVVRWRRGRVPFVARLLFHHECIPEGQARTSNPAAFEAIAINISADGPLSWDSVLPPETRPATWFLPAVIVLLFTMLQQLVSLSLVFLSGASKGHTNVERVDETG